MSKMCPTTGQIEDRSALGELIDPNLKVKPSSIYYSTVKDLRLGKKWKDKSVLSLNDVQDLWALVKENGDREKKVYLNEILAGSNLLLPGLEIPERNPELEKRLATLRNQLDEKEYQRMTKNVNPANPYKSVQEDSVGQQLKQMNSGIIAAIQFVISILAAFFFGFSGVEIFVGPLDLAVRILLGIGAAVIVGVAELYILVVLIDAREEKEAKDKKLQ